MYRLKLIVFYLAKYFGLFFFARIITRNGLRILCYHGFSLADEHLFRPKLFITREIFERRLRKIKQMKFSVIGLDHAIQSLKNGGTLRDSLVLTVDDGWQGVETIAAPLFASHHFPWTLYLTTYYAQKQTQVTNVAIQYLCWKTRCNPVNLHTLDASLNEHIWLNTEDDKSKLSNRLIASQDKLLTSLERQIFVRKLASLLDINQEDIERSRLFHLLTMDSVKKLHKEGADIELHTHRHSLGDGDSIKMTTEISTNRDVIAEACKYSAKHFCYPSGKYHSDYFSILSSCGVVSATTSVPGLNDEKTNPMELRRFLDGENIADIEFEAELSGFSEVLRRIRTTLFGAKSIHLH